MHPLRSGWKHLTSPLKYLPSTRTSFQLDARDPLRGYICHLAFQQAVTITNTGSAFIQFHWVSVAVRSGLCELWLELWAL